MDQSELNSPFEEKDSPARILDRAGSRLSKLLETMPREQRSPRARVAIACLVVFLTALGVRLLHWQDTPQIRSLEGLSHRYLRQAEPILAGEGIFFRGSDSSDSSHLLVHPPGYSILVAGVFALFGESKNRLTLIQIVADCVAAVVVVLIAAELFPLAVGVLAGLLIAFSAHLSHYTLFLLPDALASLPIVIAIYLMVRAVNAPRIRYVIMTGCLLGVACWLRSNSLLLAPAVALAIPLLFERGKRIRYATALLASAILTISPIAIRNWIAFHHFIPLSLGAGITLIEGIGDYDKEKRFDMPITDDDAQARDIEWHNRPDYAEGLWKPDGIARDRYRFSRGIDVIRANPAWFAAVMIRRAFFMLSYDSAGSSDWPFATAGAPVIALEPSFGHEMSFPSIAAPVWEASPERLRVEGKPLTARSETALSTEGRTLTISGDDAEFEDQFASARIPVRPRTDYVLRLAARLVAGRVAAKVTSTDRRVTLGSALIRSPDQQTSKSGHNTATPDAAPDANGQPPSFEIPFASGDRAGVLLVISNDGKTSARSTSEIGQAQLYELGATPHLWTRFVRPAIRTIQRRLYTTSRMLPLVMIGFGLIAMARRNRALVVLLIVPIYYLCVQSAFHTEYRYILPIHFLLFVAAAVTLYSAGKLIGGLIRGPFTRSLRGPASGPL